MAETPTEKKEIPKGLWKKCDGCEKIIYKKELENNLMVCPHCGYYFKLSAYQRIDMLVDRGTFKELFTEVVSINPLGFFDSKDYSDRIEENKRKTNLSEAVVVGQARIDKRKIMLCVLDFGFMGGSMGSVVGERVTRIIEKSIKENKPFICVSSSGGARMQEGILSLMQMAKTASALGVLRSKRIPFISVLTHPTTGGVTASFAMLGDIIISEPRALIGFAGPRVIEQTIKQKLPENFQTAEFLLEHGIIDMVVERGELRPTIIKILSILRSQTSPFDKKQKPLTK